MSEIKKSTLSGFEGLVVPSKWEIKITKVGPDTYELYYAETLDLKDKALEEQCKKDTVRIAEELGYPIYFNGNTVTVTRTGSLEDIADQITGEFLGMSHLGDMTLRDLFLGAGMATSKRRSEQK